MADTIADLLDQDPVSSGLATPRSAAAASVQQQSAHPPRVLRLSVAWGDLTQTPADIHVVGHYQGVLPVSAENALDMAISGRHGLIAEHTRRGWVAGVLGEIAYFPGPGVGGDHQGLIRLAAIAGMRRPGTFSQQRAIQLYAWLLKALLSLSSVRRAAIALIGSGAGNLTVAQAARALVAGFAGVLQTAPADESPLGEVVLVEIDRLRAERLRMALADAAADHPVLSVAEDIATQPGGDISVDSAAAVAIRALGVLARDPGSADSVAQLLERVPQELRGAFGKRLAELPDDPSAVSVSVGTTGDAATGAPSTCISVTKGDGETMRWAALTGRATIPEREVMVSQQLVDQVVERLTAPAPQDAAQLPLMLTRFVVPVDFQAHITAETALLLKVDRATARISWEFLTDTLTDDREEVLPLAIRTPIARQMRTTYSRVATDEFGGPMRALVIADPGDPAVGHNLPSARREGVAVAAVLRSNGIQVKLFVGAPGTTRVPDALPATQLDVLTELLVGGYHVVHYVGHGAFDPDRPDVAGWVFANGLLSARELTQLTRAPRLVVANARWSAARPGPPSARTTHGPAERGQRSALTPVLADEFLRVGAAHYVGASWRLPDDLAERFATTLYSRLLGSGKAAPETIGRALCPEDLFRMRGPDATTTGQPERWSAWAAYQHYGDPSDPLVTTTPLRRHQLGRIGGPT